MRSQIWRRVISAGAGLRRPSAFTLAASSESANGFTR